MKTVECYAAHAPSKPLEAWSYEIPSQTPAGQVDVAITHCGICHSDLHQLDDAWGLASFPLVPGHEIVGKVVAVGEGVPEQLAVGTRVGIGPQRSNCKKCPMCCAKQENLCPKKTKTYAGAGKDFGGFAKFIRYPADWVFVIPEKLKSEEAAPLLCAGITTFHPLKRHVKPGSKVGIVGIGGLGHVAIQYAAKMGAAVTAISRSDAKREQSLSFGATDFLMSTDKEAMSKRAMSFDVLLNTVSGIDDISKYFDLLVPGGVMAMVGLPEKTKPLGIFMQSIVGTERALVGSYLGTNKEYNEMLQFSAENGVRPMIELVPADKVNEAVARVASNKARYRVVLKM